MGNFMILLNYLELEERYLLLETCLIVLFV